MRHSFKPEILKAALVDTVKHVFLFLKNPKTRTPKTIIITSLDYMFVFNLFISDVFVCGATAEGVAGFPSVWEVDVGDEDLLVRRSLVNLSAPGVPL